jgi:HTH-type transcriptional regulator/antitoxin HigA
MMQVKIIKTESEYETALKAIENLMDAEPGSEEEELLELLSLLVEKYEDEHYIIDPPDPVEAIKFRMDQEGLTRKDLINYLGSQSKVSEVLNYKRPLSLSMIRSLHEGLGIPAEVLLQEPDADHSIHREPWQEYPFAEMFKRGYFVKFKGTLTQAKASSGKLLDDFFSVFEGSDRLKYYTRSGRNVSDQNALRAWHARVLHIALAEKLTEYVKGEVNREFIEKIAKLSYFSLGPQMAKEMLNRKGIHFIVLPHLPGTYLDGACFYAPDDRPVIGMTLRYDRLDNFWFTLAHELAHLYLHLQNSETTFFDDLESDVKDAVEEEADTFARDILIPPQKWREISKIAYTSQKEKKLHALAEQLSISPAVIAGRFRYETGDYTLFSHEITDHKVREQFANYKSPSKPTNH